jgi:pilus assembly protein CpaF
MAVQSGSAMLAEKSEPGMSSVRLQDELPILGARIAKPQADDPGPGARPDGQADELTTDPVQRLHDRLLASITPAEAELLSEAELRLSLKRMADELADSESDVIGHDERANAVDRVFDQLLGFGPIAGLLRESDISEILINGPRQVVIERRGQLFNTEVTFRNEEHLVTIIGRMIAGSGRRIDKSSPMVDVRLRDGSRLNAVLKPPSLNGPLVSIRRFGVRPLTVDDLLANEAITPEMVTFLSACVKGRINIIVSGGTGSGKTTLLNALSRFIPGTERVVTIEDTAELELQQPHVAKLESQPADLSGQGQVTMRDLVRNSLRMRPDRIIVGECRGGEAFEMLQAMSTGHEGSMTTIHAGNPREALARVELIVSLAGMDVPTWAVRKLIGNSISLVIQLARLPGGKRRITSITEITGMEGDTISMHEVFAFVQTGVHTDLGAEGYFAATGIRPHFLNRLRIRGADLPNELFLERRLVPQTSRGPAR